MFGTLEIYRIMREKTPNYRREDNRWIVKSASTTTKKTTLRPFIY